jgi:uncharacterized protein
MNYFLFKLLPPRPTFPNDLTDTEGAIMQEHFAYWSDLIRRRKAVAYGPVMDPQGPYGVAVVEVEDEATADRVAANDPAIKSRAGFRYEIHTMPDAQVRQ